MREAADATREFKVIFIRVRCEVGIFKDLINELKVFNFIVKYGTRFSRACVKMGVGTVQMSGVFAVILSSLSVRWKMFKALSSVIDVSLNASRTDFGIVGVCGISREDCGGVL